MTTQTIKRRYNQYSIEFEDMICEQYLQGKSSVMLQKEHKISPDTVLKIVRSRGHTPRTFKDIMTKYTFDHSFFESIDTCLLYTSPSPRDRTRSRMPSSA